MENKSGGSDARLCKRTGKHTVYCTSSFEGFNKHSQDIATKSGKRHAKPHTDLLELIVHKCDRQMVRGVLPVNNCICKVNKSMYAPGYAQCRLSLHYFSFPMQPHLFHLVSRTFIKSVFSTLS